MENNAISKQTVSFGLSLSLCAVLNALLVIAKEKSKTVTSTMQRLTGNHWITHVAIIILLFSIFGWFVGRMNSGCGPQISGNRLNTIIIAGVAGSIPIMLCFYAIAS